MAIQFARTAYVSRSSGGNACLKASYNERSLIKCERIGEVFNFKARDGNVYHQILLPEGAHSKFENTSLLWNTAENAEKRKNSQVAKEAVLALPDNPEITLAHRIEMTKSFVQLHFVDKGLVAQIDIHAPHEKEKNWHAHVLVATRRFKENGLEFGQKARDLNQEVRKGRVVEGWDIGESWKDHQNAFFREKEINLRVDPIGIVSQVHLGPVRMRVHMSEAMERAHLLKEANELASRDPQQMLASLTRNQSVFQEKDLDRFLEKHVEASDHLALKEAIFAKENILSLYDQETGEKTLYFTTQEVREEELKLLRFADKVNERGGKPISEEIAATVVEQKGLYEEQKAAVMHALQPGKGLAIMEGKAGTGKSYTMQAIKEIYEKSGYRVIGLAPTNQVSQDMKKDGFKESYTVHSFLFQHKNNRIPVNSDTIFILDEAAMLPNNAMIEFLHVAKEIKGKAIFFGDDRQLASVERGGMFRTLIDKLGSCELSNVLRQKGWQKEVSELLAQEKVGEAVKKLSEQGAIHWKKTKEESMASLIKVWADDRSRDQNKSQLILSNRNVDVDALNKAVREIRLEKGEISSKGYQCQTARGKEIFSQGDRVCFTETDKKLGIANGSFGEIKELSEKKCMVQLDKGDTVSFDPELYHGIKLGYASTIYKSQGKTIDQVYALHDKTTNKRLSYVALTRQSLQLKIFANQEEAKDLITLAKQMSRKDNRVPSLTFTTAEELRRAQQQDTTYVESFKELWRDIKQFTQTSVGDKFHTNKDFYTIQKVEKKGSHPVIALEQKPVSSFKQGMDQEEQNYKTHQTTLTEEEKFALSGGISEKQASQSQNMPLTDDEKLIFSGRQRKIDTLSNQSIDQHRSPQEDLSQGNTSI